MLALTLASSTPAPCPRSLFATLVTSHRRVHERRREALASQGHPVRRLHQGTPCHSAHGLTGDQSNRRSARPPLQEETSVCRLHYISV